MLIVYVGFLGVVESLKTIIFKVYFAWKCIKIMFILKKLFLILTY